MRQKITNVIVLMLFFIFLFSLPLYILYFKFQPNWSGLLSQNRTKGHRILCPHIFLKVLFHPNYLFLLSLLADILTFIKIQLMLHLLLNAFLITFTKRTLLQRTRKVTFVPLMSFSSWYLLCVHLNVFLAVWADLHRIGMYKHLS